MAFTPNQRMSASDPVLRVKGHVTSGISLADEAEYALGSRLSSRDNSGDTLIKSPLNGRYRVSVDTATNNDADPQCEFRVRDCATIVPTAWAVATNVATLTMPASHGIVTGQWIKVSGFATAPDAVGNDDSPAVVQVTGVLATGLGITYAAVTGDANATENGAVDTSKVSLQGSSKVTVYDGTVPDETAALDLGPLRVGRYIATTPGATGTNGMAEYHSDGTNLVISSYTGPVIPLGFDDADTAAMTNLATSGGNLLLNSNNGALRVRVEFIADMFSAIDTDGFACLFEKDGDLILKNRLGAANTFSIERL